MSCCFPKTAGSSLFAFNNEVCVCSWLVDLSQVNIDGQEVFLNDPSLSFFLNEASILKFHSLLQLWILSCGFSPQAELVPFNLQRNLYDPTVHESSPFHPLRTCDIRDVHFGERGISYYYELRHLDTTLFESFISRSMGLEGFLTKWVSGWRIFNDTCRKLDESLLSSRQHQPNTSEWIYDSKTCVRFIL